MKCARGHLLPKSIFIRALSSPVVLAAPALDQPGSISLLHYHTPLAPISLIICPKGQTQGLLLFEGSSLMYGCYLL